MVIVCREMRFRSATEPNVVIIRPCTSEHLDGWVGLRQRLWPDETLDEHRSHARSLLKRPRDAVGYLACEADETVVAFAEATLRRDYVTGCNSSPVWIPRGTLCRATISKTWGTSLAFFAVPLKTGPKAWAAPNLPLLARARECTKP